MYKRQYQHYLIHKQKNYQSKFKKLYITCLLYTSPILSLMSMKAMEELLPASRFMRVHRSYIVQKNKIPVSYTHLDVYKRQVISYELLSF